MIRALDPQVEATAVLDLYRRAADYIEFESGRMPDLAMVEKFFIDAPPRGDPATSLKLGLFEEGRLVGLVDLAFGFPEAHDAYLGLMLLAPEARGRGLGRVFLRHVEDAARKRGATRLLLLFLDGNRRARAFWEGQGFGSPRILPPVEVGERTHVRVELQKML